MNAIIDNLSQTNALKGIASSHITIYALDNIQTKYTEDTLFDYTLIKGETQKLQVGEVVNS